MYIMAHKKMTQEGMHEQKTLLSEDPSLKRKYETLQKVNVATPSLTSVSALIASFATKPGFRWLDVEREAMSFDLIALLQPSSVTQVDKESTRLIGHNFRYTISKINATLPEINFVQQDLREPRPLLQLTKTPSNGRTNYKKQKPQPFDLITSVFSLTRFFDNEESAKQLFRNLSSYLSPQGHLICVFRSGSDLLPQDRSIQSKRARYDDATELTQAQEEAQHLLHGLLKTLEENNAAVNKPKYARFGSPLPSEATHFIQPHQSSECLVFRNVVQTLALSAGLSPVLEYPAELMAHFEPADELEACKHFKGTCYVAIVLKKTIK